MEKQTYLGVKRVEAYPEERNGKPGYAVSYPDGYKSWSPKAAFEAAYFPIRDGRFVQDADIQAFIDAGEVDIQLNPGQVVVKVIYPNGLTDVEGIASLDIEGFDYRIASVNCMHKIRERLWDYMVFVMSWASDDLKIKGK